MPTDNHENQEHNPPKKPTPESQNSAIGSTTPHSGEEKIGNTPPANKESKRNKPRRISIDKIPQIDVIEGIEANRLAGKANTIANRATIVNGLILVVTASLALLGTCQYHATIVAQRHSDTTDSINQKRAEKIFSADTAYSSQTLKNQKIVGQKADSTDREKYKRDTATFNLQKQGLTQQIKSLKTTQNEFEIENKAYPQVSDLRVNLDSLKVKKLRMVFNIINLGKSPAKIKEGFYNVGVDSIDKSTPVIFVDNNTIGNGIQMEKRFGADISNDVGYAKIMNGSSIIFLWGQFKYESLLTKKTFVYSFEFAIKFAPILDIKTIKNDDVEIKGK